MGSVVSIGCAETNPGFSDRVHGASRLQDIEMDNAFEAQPETEVEVAMQFKNVKKIKKTKKKPVKSSCHCLAINKDGSMAKLCPRCVAKNCKTTDAKVHCAVLHKNDQVALQFKKAKKSKKTKKKKPVKSSCHCLAINKDGSVAKLCPRCVAKNCKTTDAKVHCAVLHKNDQ